MHALHVHGMCTVTCARHVHWHVHGMCTGMCTACARHICDVPGIYVLDKGAV